ncbi:ORF6N domain-containing protein [Klebsiella pneumoniae]|uniref:ORF6N domain-containing protein n=1 Tax=Klebsiella pneumoniae TaxID=573 RepID=UPI001B8CC5C1|nr:ORF6N domain-containing protein [Klebsiella pneumoniae]MBR7307458.1 ORF6N domain-containing protein [Klebsiella pneumoniae]MBR7345005.1 ORF6N domain-containing protein [Klebsiella pneumoniae]
MRNIAIDKLPITTHCNIPVMTTEMLADLYGTEPKLIRQNYQRNANRFVDGKHCYKLIGDELRAFKNEASQRGLVNISPTVSHLFLWTGRGAARHAKMLETDQAWEVFEKLEDCYFERKPIGYQQQTESVTTFPSTFSDKARMLAQEMTSSMLPAIMDALQVEQKHYSFPLNRRYQDHIHSPDGLRELAKSSMVMKLLRELDADGHDVSGAAAEVTAMLSYIVGIGTVLRDIETHAQYVMAKAKGY